MTNKRFKRKGLFFGMLRVTKAGSGLPRAQVVSISAEGWITALDKEMPWVGWHGRGWTLI